MKVSVVLFFSLSLSRYSPIFPSSSENMTPKSQEVTETTGLINENYYDSMEVQADSSSCQSDDDDHDKTNQKAFSRNCKRFIFAYKRTIFMILLGIGLLSASMLGLMTFRPKSTSSSSSSSSSKNDSDSGDDGDTTVPTDGRPFPTTTITTKPIKRLSAEIANDLSLHISVLYL